METWIDKHDGIPRHIVFEGLIGVGKTTVTKDIAVHLGYDVMLEPILDGRLKTLLDEFYVDPKSVAFQLQVEVLTQRSALERQGLYAVSSGSSEGVVFDRSLCGDTCFAEVQYQLGNITESQYVTYLKLYDLVKRGSMYPDLIVYLDVDLDVAIERINSRGRDCEGGVDGDYLRALSEAYEKYILAMRRYTQVMRVDWNEFKPIDWLWDQMIEVYSKAEDDRFQRTVKV